MDVVLMFLVVFRIDKNIVEIDEDKSFKEVLKDVINEFLKYCGSVSKTERHNKELKVTQGSVECGFPLITFTNTDQVMSVAEVKFSNDARFLNGVKNRTNKWEGIFIFDCDLIEFPVIFAGS